MTRILRGCQKNDRFIGHIGGDDFIMVVADQDADAICQSVIAAFDAGIKHFYRLDDLSAGFITVKNRKGIEESFPLISMSIVGLHACNYTSIDLLAEDAAKLKKICKQRSGSCHIIKGADLDEVKVADTVAKVETVTETESRLVEYTVAPPTKHRAFMQQTTLEYTIPVTLKCEIIDKGGKPVPRTETEIAVNVNTESSNEQYETTKK